MRPGRFTRCPRTVLGVLGLLPVAVLALCLTSARPAAAQVTFGALSNFDVFNDTKQDCHGFEIELGGITSADVLYTFGAPYQRYGEPTVVPFPGGVYIRYESQYDPASQSFIQTTPQAPSPITPTDGHACWMGGSADYLTSGCEHFGVGTNGNPTYTVYRWLVADPSTPGALQPAGTKVSIPAPVWNVAPPPPGAAAPVVAAVIELPPAPPEGQEFGEAMWVKIFKTESPEPVELHHLVTDDPGVPQEQGETEVEWVLLQSSKGNPAQLQNEAEMGEGNESVTRRYEFYQYAGQYDGETNEALCDNPTEPAQQTPERCGLPDANGVAGVGDYIGAQMAAVNLALPAGQTITVTTAAPASAAYAASFGVAATATSGLAVDITTTGGCSGSGSGSATVTMTSATTACVVRYNQTGNVNFSAASETTSSTTAQQAGQVITVTQGAPPVGAFKETFEVAATAPGGPVEIAASGACSLRGSTLRIKKGTKKTDTCTLTFDQAGDANYLAAPQVVQTTSVP